MCGVGACWFFFVCLDVDVDRDGHSDDGRAGGAAGDYDDFDVNVDFYYSIEQHHDHYFNHGADDHDHDVHQPGRADEPDAGWLMLWGLR
ncbi:hypothetical protein MAUB_38010 [Mycolicibacterium aubagnense]|uniref:Secreted protein n=1 Tax=Mycolicibacterium aubagnense TaxID=319707 RepID=A0ABM7IH04_9MYCO|nr:hypothetical protein MAUB_38010 [Mycolicibacterium aubagnense]